MIWLAFKKGFGSLAATVFRYPWESYAVFVTAALIVFALTRGCGNQVTTPGSGDDVIVIKRDTTFTEIDTNKTMPLLGWKNDGSHVRIIDSLKQVIRFQSKRPDIADNASLRDSLNAYMDMLRYASQVIDDWIGRAHV